jgi:hypothetical protein
MTLSDFFVGDRIQLHPASERWMRGDRYGEVVSLGRKYLKVRMDSGPTFKVDPRDVIEVVERRQP